MVAAFTDLLELFVLFFVKVAVVFLVCKLLFHLLHGLFELVEFMLLLV
jgi:hypothetical protein